MLWKTFQSYPTVKLLKTIHFKDLQSLYRSSMFDMDIFAQSTVYNFFCFKAPFFIRKKKKKKEIDKGRYKENIKEERNEWWFIKERIFFQTWVWLVTLIYLPLWGIFHCTWKFTPAKITNEIKVKSSNCMQS